MSETSPARLFDSLEPDLQTAKVSSLYFRDVYQSVRNLEGLSAFLRQIYLNLRLRVLAAVKLPLDLIFTKAKVIFDHISFLVSSILNSF